ncbi:MAG: lipid A biosynthesis lauroyl acyltransferase [Alphaproteobacteria bacterium]|nr:lipid A biosynthesis lauroyl acyltransferase [Alphaproteobacteria bacterium]
MKESLNKIQEYIIYIFFLLFINFTKIIGIDLASSICGNIAKLLGPFTNKGKIVRKNLYFVYGEIKKLEIKKLEQGIWENFGRYIGEFAFIDEAHLAFAGRVEVDGENIPNELNKLKKKYIVFSGHFANWDYILYTLLQTTGSAGVVYRKVNNRYINSYLLAKRTMCGASLIKKGIESGREIIKVIKNNQNLMMLVDQKMNEGIRIDFCGRPANTATGLASIARQYNYQIVPLKIERKRGAYFKISFLNPLTIDITESKEDDIRNITIQVNKILTDLVFENPTQWLWQHQRWGKPSEMQYK